MSRKAKLTPTTNDLLQAGPAANGGTTPFHIVAAHEPLPGEGFIAPQPVQFPTIPLPPKVKRSRKSKEQKVNHVFLAPVNEPKPLKIALIGTAPSSRMLAPYSDPSWTIWACSPGNMEGILPRFDAWFEVHGTNLLWPENKSYADKYIGWMRSLKCPLYMQDQQLCANAITIPKDQLVDEFGPYFFTSSFAWMMAMAIQAGASEVALFGIDMASRDEYILQRPGAYHFFQEGARRGVKMWAPYESDIFQPPALYGYSDVSPYGRKMNARKAELTERVNSLRAQRDQMIHNITYLEGALEDNDYMLAIQGGVQDNSNLSYLEKLMKKAQTTQTVQVQSAVMPSQG
jgi:hypothetical protein